MKRFLIVLSFVAVTALVAGACGEDDGGEVREVGEASDSGSASGSGSESGSASGSGSASASASAVACVPVGDIEAADAEVAVTLDEWLVTPAPASASAGSIAFAADNVGEDAHELVVVRGASAEDLPLGEDDSVDEEALPEGDFIGEIEAFPAGEVCDGAFELDPGDYVLFCNIVEEEPDGTVENHFQLGMHSEFTVE